MKTEGFARRGYSDGAVKYPSFYSSREVKEMGVDTTQIRSSRFTGVLLTSGGIYVTLQQQRSSDEMARYKSEMRVKALDVERSVSAAPSPGNTMQTLCRGHSGGKHGTRLPDADQHWRRQT